MPQDLCIMKGCPNIPWDETVKIIEPKRTSRKVSVITIQQFNELLYIGVTIFSSCMKIRRISSWFQQTWKTWNTDVFALEIPQQKFWIILMLCLVMWQKTTTWKKDIQHSKATKLWHEKIHIDCLQWNLNETYKYSENYEAF